MSVIGFDIGNESCVIAAAKRGGIDILLNDEAKRETPSVVSFGDKQRFLGSAGAAFANSNPKSTITQIKRLVGRLYKEPSVQEDLKLLPFVTSEGPHGGIMVELDYMNKKRIFSPVEILGMLFTHLKQIAEKKLESPVVDCVIGIPSYFTDLQRREYLDAAHIAGLRPLRLMHDGTAIALHYGIYKTDFPKSGSTIVVFVDIGHCDTQVTVAAFDLRGMKILSHSFDLNLGGRDFDEVLFRHFAAEFKEKYKIDVYSNPRVSIRLRASCEKLKKVLSANEEAPISIECLIDDIDIRGVIKREEFEKLSQELLDRVNVLCMKAVEDSGVSVDKIYTIELVGSGSRIPAIMKVLTSFFNKEPTRTLNAILGPVARGCVLQCAILSPTIKVRNYQIDDIYPYSIALSFNESISNLRQEIVLFPKGSPIPRDKMIIRNGRTELFFQVSYTDMTDFPPGVSPIVGHFEIGLSEDSDEEREKVEFIMKLNDHGIVEIESASFLGDKRNVMVGNSQNSILAFSEKFIVPTTKDELREAQEREHILAEQDIKVEQTKDPRNIPFVYRNFDTDKEKKVITVSVQGTKTGNMKKNNDELEQDYNGKLKMSVAGFDIGNENCVAVVKHRRIDVLLNGESKHEMPAMVSFGEKQRFFGSPAAAYAIVNSKSTISQVKRLIGRQYKEQGVQDDLRLLPFKTSEGRHGGVLIHLEYLNRIWIFTPMQILGMVFAYSKQMTEKNLESPVIDCVIGIPTYFTYLQRCEYLDAACIAGLKPLSLMHDCTAVALSYGYYKLYQPKSKPTNVMFVDIGHCDTQVTVVAFEQGQMKILSHSFDQNLGGRDFDEVLFRHFAAQFQKEHNIDVYSDTRASLRLRVSCEKLKKALSANAEATISINRLMGKQDLEGSISREEFENLSSELLERVTLPCIKAVEDSGVSADKIYTIELVGAGSRVPAITRKLGSYFQKEPNLMLDGSECVARGCALYSAMLSPALQDMDYEVQDSLPYNIGICSEEGKNNTPPISVLFQRSSLFPSFKEITFHRTATFYLDVYFTHESEFPAGVSPVGYFMIGPFEISGLEKAEIKVQFYVNRNGNIKIESAMLLEDEQSSSIYGETTRKNLGFYENVYVKTEKDDLREALEIQHRLAEQDKKAEQTKEKRNILEAFVYDTRRKLRGSRPSIIIESEKEKFFRILQETEDWLYEDGDDESEQVYTSKLKDLIKLIDPNEKRCKDENAKSEAKVDLLDPIEKRFTEEKDTAQVTKAREREQMLAEQDKKVKEKKDQKNTLESFVYDTRSKLSNAYRSFVSDSDKKVITDSLQKTEDWLYEDSDDESEQDYTRKLQDLKKLIDPIEKKYKDEKAKSEGTKAFLTCIEDYRLAAELMPSFQRREVNDECDKAEKWLTRVQQHSSNENADPMDWSSIMKTASEFLERTCKNIMRPNPSYPMHEKPKGDRYVVANQRYRSVDSNERGKYVDQDQRYGPEDPDLMYQSVYPYQKYRSAGSNQRDQSLDLNQKDRSVDPYQKYQSAGSSQRDQSLDPDLMYQSVDPYQKYRSAGSNQRDQSLDLNQKDRSVDPYQKYQSAGSSQRDQSLDSNQKDQSVDSKHRNQPVDSSHSNQPVDSKQRNEKCVVT